MSKNKVIRTCMVEHFNMNFRTYVKLINSDLNRFFVEVENDNEDLFIDFDIPKEKLSIEEVILFFDKECYKRFSCNFEFSENYLKCNGEVISFF